MNTEKRVLEKKMFITGQNICFPLRVLVEKTVYGIETLTLRQEKVLGAVVSKGHTDRFLWHERNYHYWFP